MEMSLRLGVWWLGDVRVSELVKVVTVCIRGNHERIHYFFSTNTLDVILSMNENLQDYCLLSNLASVWT